MICTLDFSQPSITDWIQSLGVFIAVVGLIINFIYQRKSTNAQLKATNSQVASAKRDFERFLMEITPRFNFKSVNIETQDVFISIELINQPIFDFYIENLSEDLISIDDAKPHTYAAGGNIAISYYPKHGFDMFDEYGFSYQLKLHYKDFLGNSYRQKITAYSNSPTVNFSHAERELKAEFRHID